MRIRAIPALLFVSLLSSAQTTLNQPDTPVRSLYAQVLARRPIGIPKGADMNVLAPFLSTALLHKMNLASACEADFFLQNRDPSTRPSFEWPELGLFSGDEEQSSPTAFRIAKTQLDKDGAIRVYVKLTYQPPPPYRSWVKHVAVVVIREGSQYLVDDVIYLKEDVNHRAEYRLTQALAWDCDGPRWIGYPKRLTSSKQQR